MSRCPDCGCRECQCGAEREHLADISAKVDELLSTTDISRREQWDLFRVLVVEAASEISRGAVDVAHVATFAVKAHDAFLKARGDS